MRVIYLALLALLALAGLVFAIENAELVEFGYFFGRIEVALSMLLALSVAAGVVIGALVAGLGSLRLHRALRASRRELAQLEARAEAGATSADEDRPELVSSPESAR